MKIDFKKEEDSVLDTLFIKLEYMSGDADAYEYETVYIDGVTYSKYKENIDKIEKIINNYKLIGRFTNINDRLCLSHGRYNGLIKEKNITDVYKYIKDEYSEELADLYDRVPGDISCDRQFKACLSDIEIHAYNEKGELLKSYI